jgi:hypothetical protein
MPVLRTAKTNAPSAVASRVWMARHILGVGFREFMAFGVWREFMVVTR